MKTSDKDSYDFGCLLAFYWIVAVFLLAKAIHLDAAQAWILAGTGTALSIVLGRLRQDIRQRRRERLPFQHGTIGAALDLSKCAACLEVERIEVETKRLAVIAATEGAKEERRRQ